MSPDLASAAGRVHGGRRGLRPGLVLSVGIAASGAILAWLILNHLAALMRVGGQIDWRFVGGSVACALASYLMVGLALREVLALLGHRLSLPAVLGIALVSATTNYFVSSAGVSGFALKAHLLRKRHVPYGITVTASVVSSAILYFVLALIVAQGLAYLVLHLRGTRFAVMEGAVGLALLIAVAAGLIVFFFNHELRGRVTLTLFHWANRAAFFFSKREIPREKFEEFETQLTEGLERIRRGGHGLTRIVAYTCCDWGLAMMALYFGFRAVGVELPVGHLSAGFTIGQAATLIPILPGGLGAVEGSMAAVFESLGLDWEKALVAVLLYRMAYYLLPGVMSVFVLWGLKVSEPALMETSAREEARR